MIDTNEQITRLAQQLSNKYRWLHPDDLVAAGWDEVLRRQEAGLPAAGPKRLRGAMLDYARSLRGRQGLTGEETEEEQRAWKAGPLRPEEMEEALDGLGLHDHLRTIARMRAEEATLREIAEEIGLSEATVRNRLKEIRRIATR